MGIGRFHFDDVLAVVEHGASVSNPRLNIFSGRSRLPDRIMPKANRKLAKP